MKKILIIFVSLIFIQNACIFSDFKFVKATEIISIYQNNPTIIQNNDNFYTVKIRVFL